MSSDDWSELDEEAKANLDDYHYREFLKYKQQLKEEGHKWDGDADEMLIGWIWDTSDGLRS